jgi:predicted hydrocarbon binding protein
VTDSEPQATAKALRAFLQGLDDVLGTHGTEMLLRRGGAAQYIGNYPPNTEDRNGYLLRYFSQVTQALFDIYGARGARAIMQRVGRAQASRGLEESASLVAVARTAMKLMPLTQRVSMVLERSARAFQDQLDAVVRVSKDHDYFYVEIQHCPYCIEWKNDKPVCFAMIGFLHRVLQRATGGTETIEEIECCAQGAAACKYRITLNPES